MPAIRMFPFWDRQLISYALTARKDHARRTTTSQDISFLVNQFLIFVKLGHMIMLMYLTTGVWYPSASDLDTILGAFMLVHWSWLEFSVFRSDIFCCFSYRLLSHGDSLVSIACSLAPMLPLSHGHWCTVIKQTSEQSDFILFKCCIPQAQLHFCWTPNFGTLRWPFH